MVQGCNQPFCVILSPCLLRIPFSWVICHISNAQLHHQLEAVLELCLFQKVESDTIIAALHADNFTDWSVEVTHVDDALCAETLHFKEIAAHNPDRS